MRAGTAPPVRRMVALAALAALVRLVALVALAALVALVTRGGAGRSGGVPPPPVRETARGPAMPHRAA